jgi:hypothetical protein
MAKKSSVLGISSVWPIIGSIVIIATAAHAFIKGGVPEIGKFTELFVLALPFATFLTTYYLLRKHVMNVITRGKEWYMSLFTLALFVVMLVLGLSETVLGPNFQNIYQNTYQSGVSGLVAIGVMSTIAVWFRIFRARSYTSALIMGFLAIALLNASPLGGLIYPPINEFGSFLSMGIVAGGNAAFEVTAFLGITAMIARVFIGREKLTPETGTETEVRSN